MKKLYNLIPVHCLGDFRFKGTVIKQENNIYLKNNDFGIIPLKTHNVKKIRSYWKNLVEKETGFSIQYVRIEKINDRD